MECECVVCGARGSKLFRCTRCKERYYCGKECQLQDWKDHKRVCRKVDDKDTGEMEERVDGEEVQAHKQAQANSSPVDKDSASRSKACAAWGVHNEEQQSSDEEDYWECTICMHPIVRGILQCKNGHLMCGECFSVRSKEPCPTCGSPMDGTRNRALEKLRDRLRNKNIDETQRKIAEQERAAAEMMKKKAEEERIAASSAAAAAAAAVARRGAEQERAIAAAAAAAAGKKRAEEERVAAERAAAEREAAEKKAQKENEARKKKESSAERDEEQERQRGASQAEKKKKKKSKKKGRGVGGEDMPEGLTWTGWTWFRNFLAVAVGVLALVLLVRVFVGTSGGAAKVGNDALNEKKQGHGFEKRFQEHAACSAYRDDLMHPEALQCFLQARQDAVKLHGKNAEIVGFIERSLGEIFTKRTKKNFIESRRHYIEGLRIAQITDGKMSEIAGDALDGIGVSHYLEGHYDKALQKFEEALKVFKEVLGAENDKVSRILQFLCTCYYHVGRAEDGLSAHEQSLQSVREKYGDNIQLANVHLNIATAPTTDGEMRVAHLNVQLQSAKEAMRIADKLGSSGPTVESQGRVDAATMAIKALMDRSVQPLLKEMGTHLCELDDDEDGEFDDELDDDEDGEFDYELDDDELDELRRIWRA